jgi:hypothetical protein
MVFEIEMTIRGRKFSHPVTVVEDINNNILDIDFMHTHKLNYNSMSKQITFAHMLPNALYSVKEVTIPALSIQAPNGHQCQQNGFGPSQKFYTQNSS